MKSKIIRAVLITTFAASANVATASPVDDDWHECLQRGVLKEGFNAAGASRSADSVVRLLMSDCPSETLAWQSQCTSTGRDKKNCEIEEMVAGSAAIKTYGK